MRVTEAAEPLGLSEERDTRGNKDENQWRRQKYNITVNGVDTMLSRSCRVDSFDTSKNF